MRSAALVLVVLVVAAGWTYRGQLPFLGSSGYGSAAGARVWLVQVSDQGLLGGKPGPHPAAGATCAPTSRPGWVAENPTLVQAGVGFSFYNCRLRLKDHTSQRLCVAAGGGGGTLAVQYTAVGGTCQRPIILH